MVMVAADAVAVDVVVAEFAVDVAWIASRLVFAFVHETLAAVVAVAADAAGGVSVVVADAG